LRRGNGWSERHRPSGRRGLCLATCTVDVSARSSVIKRAAKWLGLVCLALVAVVGLILAGLHTPQGRGYVLSKVTDLLASRQIDFRADQLRYNLLDLSLDLRDVTIRSPRGEADPPFAVIGRLQADLSLRALLRGRYVLQSGSVERARVHYLVDEHGDNLPRPPRDPNAPDQPLDYLVESLDVTDAVVRYENRVQQLNVALPVPSMTIRGDAAADRHTVALTTRAGSVAMAGRDLTIDALTAEVIAGEDDLEIVSAQLDAANSRLEVTGTLRDFAAPSVDARVRADIDVAAVADAAALQEPVGGRLSMDATAAGPLRTPTVDARVQGRDLAVRTLEDLALDGRLGYDGARRHVSADDLQLRAPWGALDGSGAVSIDEGPSRLRLSARDLDLAAVMRAANLDQRVASQLDATADLRWPALDYAAAEGTADLSLTPTRTRASRQVMPVSGRVAVRGDGRRLDANIRQLRAAGATVEGTVAIVDRERLDGAVRLHAADIGGTVAAAEVFLARPRDAFMSRRVSGPVSVDARLGGTVQRATAEASVEAPALEVDQAGTLALSARARYTPEAVTLHTADVAWGDARAHAEGVVGLEGRQPLDLRFRVDALAVPSLLALAGQDPSVAAGTLWLSGRAGGAVTAPRAAATLQGRQLSAAGEPLGRLDADVAVDGRQIVLRRLVLDKPQEGGDGQLTAHGSYDLESRAYAYEVRSAGLRLTQATLPDGRPLRGELAIAGEGRGSVDSPSGRLDLTMTGARLADHDLGNISLDAVAAEERVTLDVLAERFGLTSKAVVQLTETYPAVVEARVDDLDLGRLPVALQTPLEGRLSATANASLPLTDAARGNVDARVDAFEGAWNAQPFALDGPAELRLADERVTINRLRLTAQDSSLEVRGDLPLNVQRGEGEIAIDARANLETLARYAPAGTSVTAGGDLALTGRLRGNLEFIDPELQLSVANASVTTPTLGAGVTNLNARARVGGGVATLEELTANWSAAAIEARASVPLDLLPELPVAIPRRGGPAEFRAGIAGLDPASLPGAPEGLTGLISVNTEGSASRPDLASLTASLTFPELRVAFRDLTLEQQGASTVRIAGGRAVIDRFSLAGSAGTLGAQGTVGLLEHRPVDVRVEGDFNTAAASSFTDAVHTEGRARLDVAATGTVAEPRLAGFLALEDVTVAVDEPEIVAQQLNARVDLSGDRLTLTTLSAAVNGGTLTGSGGLAYRNGALDDVNVQLNTKDFAFDAPLDLRSLSDSTLVVTERGDDLLVSGKVLIREAGLTGDINFDTGLLATLDQPRSLDLTEERNPLLERVAFNVQVQTTSPILVDNNLARAEVRTSLRVLGSPYETGLTGTLTVAEGGEITLNERRYEVERATITFLEERRIAPSFDLRLNTSAGNYDVTLAVSGEPGDTETTLTSSPVLPEPDIMALLVTGRTLEQMRGEEGDIAKEQVLSYLAGRVGSQLGRGIEQATGLSEVRLEPNLIANEADPSARMTVAQELTDDLRLIYSTDLADSNDQMWVARYDVTRRFQANAVRQPEGSYRVDFRHDVRFGGRPAPRRLPRTRPTVSTVEVAADDLTRETALRDRFGVEAGDRFDYFAARDGVDRVTQALQEEGRLQARVRLDRVEQGGAVALTLRVEPGPLVRLGYQGAQPPRKVDEEVRRQWSRGVFDAQRVGDATEALRAWLIGERYLQSTITHQVADAADGSRQVTFAVTPGPRSEQIVLEFAGASAIDPSTLDSIIDEQDLEMDLFTDPVVPVELLEKYYREEGYLSADVEEPRYEFEGPVARAILRVHEGPRFTISDVSVRGNRVLATDMLLAELPVTPGDPFLPRAVANALERVRDLYWRRAYNDMRAEYSLVLDRAAGRVAVNFDISEGPQSVIADIRVAGNRKASDRLVTEQLEIEAGQPLDLAVLGRSRRNLYETGAFSLVDITREPVAKAAAAESVTTTSGSGDAAGGVEPGTTNGDEPQGVVSGAVKPVVVDVRLREVQPLQLRYGASYDTEHGLGGIVDLLNHNSLGKARVLGLAARYDASVREGRVYFSQPALRYWPVSTTASVYYTEERNAESELADPFNVDRFGVSVQQERTLGNRYVWNYGYRWERARKFAALPDATGERITVSPLTSTFTREARDEVLDASRGSFTSHGFSYSPTWLGADASYIKYYGQYAHYFPLEPERRKRFTNEILRPRFVYATGVRLGLAHGFGDRVPETERFYAGGSNTLRGFEQNAVGPIGPDRIPTGGEALLVFNNEVRVPLFRIVDGVGFVDIGNVFDRFSDFDITDLRETAGVGIRVRTPWFLVRGDYGFVLDQRPGERRSRFYFSIGQAF
jgi:outer membrane protein assembly factor BamA/autotransporter translocation and assembly factor TamB